MRNGYRDDLLLDTDEEVESAERKTGVEVDEISEIIEETRKEIRAIFATLDEPKSRKLTKNA
jgi:hypothetical protein